MTVVALQLVSRLVVQQSSDASDSGVDGDWSRVFVCTRPKLIQLALAAQRY